MDKNVTKKQIPSISKQSKIKIQTQNQGYAAPGNFQLGKVEEFKRFQLVPTINSISFKISKSPNFKAMPFKSLSESGWSGAVWWEAWLRQFLYDGVDSLIFAAGFNCFLIRWLNYTVLNCVGLFHKKSSISSKKRVDASNPANQMYKAF